MKASGFVMATAVCALFATQAYAQDGQKTTTPTPKSVKAKAPVSCKENNSCAGKGSCKSDANACGGKNSCKGHVFGAKSAHECKAKKGTVEKAPAAESKS